MAVVTKLLSTSTGNVWQLVEHKKAATLCLFLFSVQTENSVPLFFWKHSLKGRLAHSHLLQVRIHADES